MRFVSPARWGRLRLRAGTDLPVAIDFGVGSLKVLRLQAGAGENDPPQLVAAGAVETPPELVTDHGARVDFQVEQLARLASALGLKNLRGACSIPATQTFCKHMQLARDADGTLEGPVSMSVAAALRCVPDALVCRHVEVSGSAGKAEVICLGASRDLVRKFMGAMRAARLDPVGMHPEVLALLRSFDHITRRVDDAGLTSLYIDIGYGSSKVSVAHGRELVFAKLLQLGGRHLDGAVAAQLNCDPVTARARRIAAADLVAKPSSGPAPSAAAEAGGGMALLAAGMSKAEAEGGAASEPATADADATVLADRRNGKAAPGLGELPTDGPGAKAGGIDLSEPLETLTDEIAMCLRYHESLFPGKRPDRVVFTGGEARHRGLCQHVARTLRMNAQLADPLARLGRDSTAVVSGVDLSGPQPGWAVALGVALAPTDL
jgi:Tfp pilus assembly PilM family ATPase